MKKTLFFNKEIKRYLLSEHVTIIQYVYIICSVSFCRKIFRFKNTFYFSCYNRKKYIYQYFPYTIIHGRLST